MNETDTTGPQSATGPENGVIAALLDQHVRIKELFAAVDTSSGEAKREAFDELRELLAVHETGEEMILRPVSRRTAGADVTYARNYEEDEARVAIADLQKLDVGSKEFDDGFARLEQAVTAHAAREEEDEFPTVLAELSPEELREMGEKLSATQGISPTRR
jgi:hypothetical protein